MSTIAELLRSQYELRPDAVALLAPGRVPATYADLHALALRVTGTLRAAGFDHRSRIALCVPNGPEAAAAAIAITAGATCAPLDPGCRAAEIRFHLERMHADAVFVCRRQRGAIRCEARELGIAVFELDVDANGPAGIVELHRTQPGSRPPPHAAAGDIGQRWPGADDLALILHTTDAAARREIVALSQSRLVASARDIAAQLALEPTDRGLNVMPLFDMHGLVGALLPTLAAGASLVCTAGFDENTFFGHVAEFDPSWYSAEPSIHQAIVANGTAYRARAPLHAFRFAGSASAALSPATLAQLESLLGAPVVEALLEHRGKPFTRAHPGRCDHAGSPLLEESAAR